MRGAGGKKTDTYEVRGIIPARAGSSHRHHTIRPKYRDHPRACGEQNLPNTSAVPIGGSSPRVRGAELFCSGDGLEKGIIPARAGSSKWITSFQQTIRDHPRACGEQDQATRQPQIRRGSSPRVRGAVLTYETDAETYGIIPARAGSRSVALHTFQGLRDHPRACGEQASSRKAG